MLDSSSLYNINRSVSVLDPDSHLLGSYLNRKQPNTYINVNVFISTINLVTSNVCETLAHRISSLYTQNPDEVMWVDSCGENSLHRLCQLARFRNDKDKQKYELIDSVRAEVVDYYFRIACCERIK